MFMNNNELASFRYLAVGLLHIPCYGIFALLVRLKHLWLSRSFPGSSQFVRWYCNTFHTDTVLSKGIFSWVLKIKFDIPIPNISITSFSSLSTNRKRHVWSRSIPFLFSVWTVWEIEMRILYSTESCLEGWI